MGAAHHDFDVSPGHPQALARIFTLPMASHDIPLHSGPPLPPLLDQLPGSSAAAASLPTSALPHDRPLEHCGYLPSIWHEALSHEPGLRLRVCRLPVLGDGTCADGAILQATDQSDALDRIPISRSASMMGSATRPQDHFHDHVVGAAVDAWLSADWVAKFRDEEWSEQLRLLALKPASERGPEDRVRTSVRELALFRASLTTRTLPMGLAYLHVAAGVLQQGILLLGSDSRINTLTSLHDFGTQQRRCPTTARCVAAAMPSAMTPGTICRARS